VAIEVAADDTAGHIKRFWDPRMRHALIQHVDAYGDEELLPVVAAALDRNRTALLGGKQSIDEEEQWKVQIPFFMIKQSNDMISLIDGHDQRL